MGSTVEKYARIVETSLSIDGKGLNGFQVSAYSLEPIRRLEGGR